MKRAYKTTRACRGKVRYRDEAQARVALRGIRERSSRAEVPHRAYECIHCNGWHLTSKERRT